MGRGMGRVAAVTAIPVVFMANDRFAHWALPFLRSLRATNPDRELLCIPFADDLATLRDLAGRFGFRFLDADYAAIDAVAATHFPNEPYRRRRLRKLAAFDLPRFLYLDCDLLVVAPLDAALARAAAATAGLVYFALSPEWVYAAAAAAEVRARFAGRPRFSTGALLALEVGLDCGGWLAALAAEEALWRRLRAPFVIDQPAINLVAHRRAMVLTDLDAVAPGWTGRGFAGSADLADGPDGLTRQGRRILCVHWAGATKDALSPALARIVTRFAPPVGVV